jgi:hypothetical protein
MQKIIIPVMTKHFIALCSLKSFTFPLTLADTFLIDFCNGLQFVTNP